jgi:hypothetical protein
METLSLVRQEPRSTPFAPRAKKTEALRSATAVAKWKNTVESVNQLEVVAIGAPLAETTRDETQKRRPLVPAIDRDMLRLDDIPLISFEPMQEWEGVVVNITQDTFEATLIDITARRKYEEEIAEFPIADVSDDDRNILKTGAIFRWLIGYERHPSGVKRRVSSVVFRRLSEWSKADLIRAKLEAQGLVSGITWE